MKKCFLSLIAILLAPSHFARATEADDTTITITGQQAGPTPFISQITLTASDTSVLRRIQFVVTSKPGSVVRPLSAVYSHDHLAERGDLISDTGEIFLPVYGLYAGFENTITLIYYFTDGSSKEDILNVTTETFDDTCGYGSPTILQERNDSTSLSYDYILIKGTCGGVSSAIIDTDGALRWVGTGSLNSATATFYDNAIYQVEGTALYRIELDGTVSLLRDFTNIGVTELHHNIDRGKNGLLLEASTATQFESTVLEIDSAGVVLNTWNMAEIISSAMIAGGDDPDEFVFPAPADWFHNNATTYNRADDTLIISSRENFVIALDHETSAIKWIFGDPTKLWHQFPSLSQYALTFAADTLPPIGQHALSITYDQDLLLFDNGFNSSFHVPAGASRGFASARKYKLDLSAMTATEVWNYEMDQSIYCPICGSVYEDAPLNYLVDYSDVNGPEAEVEIAQLLGLDAQGEKIFHYQYPTFHCTTAFNAIPLHLENTLFPRVGPQALNLSTRATVGVEGNPLIGGFIITGAEPKTVVLRALGPSLSNAGLAGALTDPVLTLFDASGTPIETNDNWQTGANSAQVTASGLAPAAPEEAVILTTLMPAAYTAVVTGKDSPPGIALVELYELSALSNSKLANISTRGFVGLGDNVLIGGFIIGDVGSATLIVRALGPSLAPVVSASLSDPVLTIYDVNGVAIAGNDNWPDDVNSPAVAQNQLAPESEVESAIILHPPAGAYSAIVTGAGGSSGVALVEVYDLD